MLLYREALQPLQYRVAIIIVCVFSLLAISAHKTQFSAAQSQAPWVAAGQLVQARSDHTTTVLLNGKILVAGGRYTPNSSTPLTYLSHVELYDPATQQSVSTGSLQVGREEHTATLLPNGKVLVAGGYRAAATLAPRAELYDPVTGTWSDAGAMIQPRVWHEAALLPNGKVLVAGGRGDVGGLDSVEIYNPATNSWSAASPMSVPRSLFRMITLTNQKVLAVGGVYDPSIVTSRASAELFDPITGQWSPTGSLTVGRSSFGASLLPNGNVLVSGGVLRAAQPNLTDTAEIYNPQLGIWQTTTSMLGGPQAFPLQVTLANGVVLVIREVPFTGNSLFVQEFHPDTNQWLEAPALPLYVLDASVAQVSSGKVFFVGGSSSTSSYSNAVYRYDNQTIGLPNTPTSTASAVPPAPCNSTAQEPQGVIAQSGGSEHTGYLPLVLRSGIEPLPTTTNTPPIIGTATSTSTATAVTSTSTATPTTSTTATTTSTATSTNTVTLIVQTTAIPTATNTATTTPTLPPAGTATATGTATPTCAPNSTATPTSSSTSTPTATSMVTPTPTRTQRPTPTNSGA